MESNRNLTNTKNDKIEIIDELGKLGNTDSYTNENTAIPNSITSSYRNQKGLIVVFSPIVIFGFLFGFIDNYFYTNNYETHPKIQECIIYSNTLCIKRFIIFAIYIISWEPLKQIISGYVLLMIFYVFNILMVFSDVVNIQIFMQAEVNVDKFDILLAFRIIVNYMFVLIWGVILLINMNNWYQVSQHKNRVMIDDKDEGEENDMKSKTE